MGAVGGGHHLGADWRFGKKFRDFCLILREPTDEVRVIPGLGPHGSSEADF